MTNHDKNDIAEMLLVYAIAEDNPKLTEFLGSIVTLGIGIILLGIALCFILGLLGIL